VELKLLLSLQICKVNSLAASKDGRKVLFDNRYYAFNPQANELTLRQAN
jgi:hypothetical protein